MACGAIEACGFRWAWAEDEKKTKPIRGILLHYGIWWEDKIGKKKVGRKRILGGLKAYL
jgi:hypothetical protein